MKKLFFLILVTFSALSSAAELDTKIPFTKDSGKYWQYISDRTMGGISNGKATLEKDGEMFFARLSGNVSTENNGGFIQFATGIEKIDKNFEGIKLRVRGNNENYQLHLRTKYTPAPWQYYSAEFNVTNEWKEVIIPFTTFKKSNFYQPGKFKSSNIKSIGIVAIGKDFEAEIDLGRIELY